MPRHGVVLRGCVSDGRDIAERRERATDLAPATARASCRSWSTWTAFSCARPWREVLIGELERTVARMGRAIAGERREVDAETLPPMRAAASTFPPCRFSTISSTTYVPAPRPPRDSPGDIRRPGIADAVAARIGGFASATGTRPGRTMTTPTSWHWPKRDFPTASPMPAAHHSC